MDNLLLVLRLTKRQLSEDIKYLGIIKAFSSLGCRVWYTYSDGADIFISNGSEKFRIGHMFYCLKKITKNTALTKALTDFIRNSGINFKYCYIRSMPAVGRYKDMLREMKKKNIKIAVELPTYPDTGELKTDKLWRRVILTYLKRFKVSAAEFTDLYLPMGEHADRIYGRPAVNIENGVDIEALNLRHKKQSANDEIHILAVAKIARWHGYDRIIEGMKIYYQKNPKIKVYFHIVGPDGDGTLKKYESLISLYSLSEYVIVEGPKFGADADSYFDMADIAAATLNKQGMSKVYSLKIGEYMARGIPFIYAEPEGHVDKSWDFCMEVPSDGTPVDIDKIVEFCKKINKMPKISEKMRKIAEEEFSWEKQLGKMIDYFDKH